MLRYIRWMRVVPIAAALIALAAGPTLARFALQPSAELTRIPVGKVGTDKDYFLLGSDPIVIPITGPGEVIGYAKIHYKEGDVRERSATVLFSGVPGVPTELSFAFTPPKRGNYGDGRKGMPSSGKKIAFSVPAGTHDLRLTGSVEGGGELFILLYYAGPPQVGAVTPALRPVAKVKKAFKPKLFGWKLRSGSGLKFTYDDNAYKYSGTFQDEYRSGWAADKYKNVDRVDDLLINPSLNLEGRKKLIALGETRLKLSWSGLVFWHNEKLNNYEYRLTVRQATGKGKSIEFYYSYSPSKYLRQLNDRPPFVSGNTPVVGEEFRLERNKFVATWRQKLHKKVSGTLTLTQQLYYYNKPHLENDINSIEIKTAIATKLTKTFDLKLTYAFRNADARIVDFEGQVLDLSPLYDWDYIGTSDGTYNQNHYQADLGIKIPNIFGKTLVSKIGLRAQYQEAVFPGPWARKIEDDTYHVGRVDNFYTYQISASRKLPYGISGSFGARYAERDTESPWWGDIKEDKNWISKTVWFGMSYRLF